MGKSNQLKRWTGLAKRQWPKAPRPRLAVVGVLMVLLAGCILPPSAVPVPIAEISATAVPAVPAGILGGEPQPTTFDQIKEAIDKLYSTHPDVNSFVVRGVTYNTETRDKVLKVCREGGLAGDDAQRESQRVLACAPLILFFYSYGQQSGVQASTDVSRYLYWYAKGNDSQKSVEVLTELLKSWEIQ